MESLLNKKVENPKQLSPQTLAFVGDTVYDLLVTITLHILALLL